MRRRRSRGTAERATAPQQRYDGNLMAETGGTLSAQNVADVAAENAPSPYWIHDDDQVAAWISAHSTAEIGKLSTADKLRAIRTLQEGWVSAQDLAARICSRAPERTSRSKGATGSLGVIYGSGGRGENRSSEVAPF